MTSVKGSIGIRLKRIADLCLWSACNQSVLPFSCRISHVLATTERARESAWDLSAYDVESLRAWHTRRASAHALTLPKTERKHPDNDQWQPTSKSLDSSWRAKSITDMVVKVIQFDAQVDPVLARMEPVFAYFNPVFSFPWKCKGNSRHLVPWNESFQL